MKERPILFSGPMVKAILDGRKTQTRRVVKGDIIGDPESIATIKSGLPKNKLNKWGCIFKEDTNEFAIRDFKVCQYGGPGEHLWVRETFSICYNIKAESINPLFAKHIPEPIYKADNPVCAEKITWKPSIHMPRAASRINLEITSIKVQRLQDISEEDARAEGLSHDCCGWFVHGNAKTGSPTAKECFSQLWDSTNGKKYPWSSNPFVWVVEFKQIKH